MIANGTLTWLPLCVGATDWRPALALRGPADLPNEGRARTRAIEDIKALWKSSSISQRDPAECCVVVTSMDDTELFRLPFVEVPGVVKSGV